MNRLFNKKSAFLLSLATLILFVPLVAHAQDDPWYIDMLTGGFKFVFEIIILPVFSALLGLAGLLFDKAVNFGLHTGYIFSLSEAVNLGWSIIRDVANIIFIFILIYISLGTIVQGTKFGTKQLLTQVIIAALLINFSLFITKAVVDVSNIFGNWAYRGVQKTLQVNTANYNPDDPNAKVASISDLISHRLGIIQWWRGPGGSNVTDNNSMGNILQDPSKNFLAIFLRSAVVLIAIYIFIHCAVLFLGRSITILFLLVFSPIGFMGGVLPQLKKYAGQWRDELLAAAMFPIAFLIMLYISLQFINSLKYLGLETLNDQAFGGISVSIYFQYFLIIFLLHACLKIAKENSGEMGKALGGLADSLGKLAVNAGIGLGTGGASILGRSIAAASFAEKGKGLKAVGDVIRSSSPLLTSLTTGPSVWQKTKYVAKKGTYDVRNLKAGGFFGPNVAEMAKSATGYDVSKTGNVLGFTTDQRSSKEISTDRKAWDEEIALDTAQKAILEDMRELMKLQATLEEAKRSNPAGVAAAQILVDAKKMDMRTPAGPGMLTTDGRIRENLSKLNNKQLEKLGIKINANEHVAGLMTAGEIKHLKENSELSENDKNKVWAARTRPLTDALAMDILTTPPALRKNKLGEALKRFSDGEVAELSIDKLTDEHVMDNLTSGQLGKIAQNFARGDRQAIRDYIIRTQAPTDPARRWLETKTQGQAF